MSVDYLISASTDLFSLFPKPLCLSWEGILTWSVTPNGKGEIDRQFINDQTKDISITDTKTEPQPYSVGFPTANAERGAGFTKEESTTAI